MFDFWDLATSALKGGLNAFLGSSSGGGKGGYTDNSSFNANDQKRGIPKAGKSKAAPIAEGATPGFNQGGAMSNSFNPNFEWKGAPFNTSLKNFLDYDDKDED